jgi:two-component system, sensor histidine kinase and response regulator
MVAAWRMKPVPGGSGAEANEILERAAREGNPYRLVLLDAHMPETSGFELVSRWKQDARLRKTAVILFVSAGHPEELTRARNAGAAAALTKPVKQSELWDAIMTALVVPGWKKKGRGTIRRTTQVRRPLRVLVAEDNPVNQELALHLLERRGHSVIVAENGRQALAAISKHEFDLVLMDVQMPELGGLEATAAIRTKEKETGTHLPIVALTAHAMQGDRERCLAAGMDGYIAKPLDPRQFLQTVEAFGLQDGARDPDRGGADGSVNRESLLERFSGDRKLLGSLVRSFSEDSEKMMSRIRSALAARNASTLAEAAHALKGSVANFGASAAFETAKEVEKIARQGKLDGAWDLYATLEEDLGRLLPALRSASGAKGKAQGPSHHSSRRKG